MTEPKSRSEYRFGDTATVYFVIRARLYTRACCPHRLHMAARLRHHPSSCRMEVLPSLSVEDAASKRVYACPPIRPFQLAPISVGHPRCIRSAASEPRFIPVPSLSQTLCHLLPGWLRHHMASLVPSQCYWQWWTVGAQHPLYV